MPIKTKAVLISLLMLTSLINSQELKNHTLKSDNLKYEVAFDVLLPDDYSEDKKYPVLYATDGKGLLQRGFRETVQKFQNRREKEFITVFVSHLDIKTGKNRRNKELLCNMSYFNFFTRELMEFINKAYVTSAKAEDTMLMGISFGGLNAFFFGKHTERFGKIAIISPAIHPCPSLIEEYKKADKRPFDVFLSTGTKGDNFDQAQRLKALFESKGNNLKYNEVPYGHNFQNFKANYLPMLSFFFK